MKLKYRLEKWEKALVFQVLEMDERFRGRERGSVFEYRAHNGLCVQSIDYPEIIRNTQP